MRVLHLLLPLLLLLLLHVAADEEDYGGDAQDAYADSQESEEKREEEKLKAKKKEEELEQIEESRSEKFLEILSYIQSKEREVVEGAVKKGHKEFQAFVSHISGLIKDKKYMNFSVPKKVNILHWELNIELLSVKKVDIEHCTNHLFNSFILGRQLPR